MSYQKTQVLAFVVRETGTHLFSWYNDTVLMVCSKILS